MRHPIPSTAVDSSALAADGGADGGADEGLGGDRGRGIGED